MRTCTTMGGERESREREASAEDLKRKMLTRTPSRRNPVRNGGDQATTTWEANLEMKTQRFEQLRSSKGEKAAFISPQQTRAINARIDNLAGDGMLEEDSCRNKHARGTVNPLRGEDAFPTTGAQPAPCPHRRQRPPNIWAISPVRTGEDATRKESWMT